MLKIVSLYLILLLGENALACSCVHQSHKIAFEKAKHVFRGKVVEIKKANGMQAVKLQVNRVWKGTLGVMADVSTPQSPAACGVKFKEGREYLVFTLPGKAQMATNVCANTDATESPKGGGGVTWLDINRPPKKTN